MKVSEIVERAARHWMEDGSVELAFGIQAVLTGAVFWIGQSLAPESTFSKAYSFLAAALWGSIIFGTQWAIRQLKERVVAPRAGYVALRQSNGPPISSARQWLTIATISITPVGVIVLALYVTLSAPTLIDGLGRSRWIVGFGCALVFVLIAAWSAIYYKVPRYFLLALWSLCFAVWVYGRNGDVIVACDAAPDVGRAGTGCDGSVAVERVSARESES